MRDFTLWFRYQLGHSYYASGKKAPKKTAHHEQAQAILAEYISEVNLEVKYNNDTARRTLFHLDDVGPSGSSAAATSAKRSNLVRLTRPLLVLLVLVPCIETLDGKHYIVALVVAQLFTRC